MKKLLFTLALALALAPAADAAVVLVQRITTKTHLEGRDISGVEASSAFDVVLVRSDRTKAVVEICAMMEQYVYVNLGPDGVVSVGLNNVPDRLWRTFNRIPEREQVMKLTLHLPRLNTVRLSGATDLYSADTFPGEDVDIQLSGASDIDETLRISSRRVKLQCSGASEAELSLSDTQDLVVIASGASDVDITANGVAYSKLGVSGASDVEIRGSGERGEWTASGSSELDGEDFVIRDLTINASGASSAEVNVTGTLNAEASGASSVRYAGRPASINSRSHAVRPL